MARRRPTFAAAPPTDDDGVEENYGETVLLRLGSVRAAFGPSSGEAEAGGPRER